MLPHRSNLFVVTGKKICRNGITVCPIFAQFAIYCCRPFRVRKDGGVSSDKEENKNRNDEHFEILNANFMQLWVDLNSGFLLVQP